MDKLITITIPIALMTIVSASVVNANQDSPSCNAWMANGFLSQYKTDAHVIEECDDLSFTVLSHEYAKDINYVYYKPMPNAHNMTHRVLQADPDSFQVGEDCSTAWDAHNIFDLGKRLSRNDDRFKDLLAYKTNSVNQCNMIRM